jgi:hypothetical protein
VERRPGLWFAVPGFGTASTYDAITSGICDRRNGVQGLTLHGSNLNPLMSALGHSRTLPPYFRMSALPAKARTSAKTVVMSANAISGKARAEQNASALP